MGGNGGKYHHRFQYFVSVAICGRSYHLNTVGLVRHNLGAERIKNLPA